MTGWPLIIKIDNYDIMCRGCGKRIKVERGEKDPEICPHCGKKPSPTITIDLTEVLTNGKES